MLTLTGMLSGRGGCVGIDGGQGGCATNPENQPVTLSNSGNGPIEYIEEIDAAANRKKVAALWLHQHRDTLSRPVIPTLRERFGLTIIEAIEAGKLAHRLAYGGTHG